MNILIIKGKKNILIIKGKKRTKFKCNNEYIIAFKFRSFSIFTLSIYNKQGIQSDGIDDNIYKIFPHIQTPTLLHNYI